MMVMMTRMKLTRNPTLSWGRPCSALWGQVVAAKRGQHSDPRLRNTLRSSWTWWEKSWSGWSGRGFKSNSGTLMSSNIKENLWSNQIKHQFLKDIWLPRCWTIASKWVRDEAWAEVLRQTLWVQRHQWYIWACWGPRRWPLWSTSSLSSASPS